MAAKIRPTIPPLASLAAIAVQAKPEESIHTFLSQKGLEAYLETSSAHIQRKVDGLLLPHEETLQERNIAVLVTGSDARNEKVDGRSSPLQFLFATNEGVTEADLALFTSACPDVMGVDPRFEVKGEIPKEAKLEWKEGYCRTMGKLIPQRFLNSRVVVGREESIDAANRQFIIAVKALNTKDRKKCRTEYIKGALRLLRVAINDDGTKGVDLKRGVAIFDNKNQKGTKYPVLRAFQYPVEMAIVVAVYHLPIEEGLHLLKTKPDSLPERIDFCITKGLLKGISPDDAAHLKATYYKSLVIHHTSQLVFQSLGGDKTVELRIPRMEEYREALTRAVTILSGMTITHLDNFKG